MVADRREPIALDDCRTDAWQRLLPPCPEHARACGPLCEVLWGSPMARALQASAERREQMIRRAAAIPTPRLLAAGRGVENA